MLLSREAPCPDCDIDGLVCHAGLPDAAEEGALRHLTLRENWHLWMTSHSQMQGGVLAMADQFPNAKPPMTDVQDTGDMATHAVPRLTMRPASAATARRRN
jgi:hypothetical protein